MNRLLHILFRIALFFIILQVAAGCASSAFAFMPLDTESHPSIVSDSLAQNIFESVAGGRPLKKEKPRATFEDKGELWTIIGAYAPLVDSVKRPARWPITGSNLSVQVVRTYLLNRKVLPWTENFSDGMVTNNMIEIRGCPGEYESASFVLRSGDLDFQSVSVAASDLLKSNTAKRSKCNKVASKNVDIRVVKCWYQAGTELSVKDRFSKTLTPELLLKDDSVIEVNHKYQVNLIKNFNAFQDSAELKPFVLKKRENKQIWITVHIPEKADPGIYRGAITIVADKVQQKVPIKLEVLPFSLDGPVVQYSMFYDSELLARNQQFRIAGNGRSDAQMLAELKDMREHGVTNPVITMKSWDSERLARVLDLRRKAGINNDVIYYVAWPGLKNDQTYMKKVIDHCAKAVAYLKAQGVSEVYFYGFDEIKHDKLLDAQPIYKMFQVLGAKTFVTGEKDFFLALGASIDIPIIWGQGGNISRGQLQGLARNAHESGKKAWIYSFPQNGKEEPDTYRRNFGITLWKLGIDGACNYAYQGMMNHPWDDFDHPVFRDEIMAYPTIDGIVPTTQWAGWREGVKDVRYLSTLLKLRSYVVDNSLRNRIERAIADIDPDNDLDKVRDKIIELIIEAHQSIIKKAN